MAALRVGRLDLDAGRLAVAEALVRGTGGRNVFGPPKSKAGKRTMFMPKVIVTMLSAHLEHAGFTDNDTDELVFTDEEGGPLSYSNRRRRGCGFRPPQPPAGAGAGVRSSPDGPLTTAVGVLMLLVAPVAFLGVFSIPIYAGAAPLLILWFGHHARNERGTRSVTKQPLPAVPDPPTARSDWAEAYESVGLLLQAMLRRSPMRKRCAHSSWRR